MGSAPLLLLLLAAAAAASDFEKGEQLFQQGDTNAAVVLFRRAAEQGHECAMHRLAWCLRTGVGCDKNEHEATQIGRRLPTTFVPLTILWLAAVAYQGYAPAQSSLGVYFITGTGVAQDYAMAASLFRQAADQGYAEAQYNLGTCYANGHGVEKNQAMAMEWLREAADRGYADAQFRLGVLYGNGHVLAPHDIRGFTMI